MATRIEALTDSEAVEALQSVTRKWMDRSGPAALLIWQKLSSAHNPEPLADWLLDPKADMRKAGEASKRALEALKDAKEFRGLADEAIEATKVARAHFDPVSLAIMGTMAIGLVLAARTKSVGKDGWTFYEGLPDGLDKIIRACVSAIPLGS